MDKVTHFLKGLEQENATLKDENATLKDENAAFKDENAAFKDENAALKDENAALKDENAAFKDENAAFKDENAAFKEKLHPSPLSLESSQSAKLKMWFTSGDSVRLNNVKKFVAAVCGCIDTSRGIAIGYPVLIPPYVYLIVDIKLIAVACQFTMLACQDFVYQFTAMDESHANIIADKKMATAFQKMAKDWLPCNSDIRKFGFINAAMIAEASNYIDVEFNIDDFLERDMTLLATKGFRVDAAVPYKDENEYQLSVGVEASRSALILVHEAMVVVTNLFNKHAAIPLAHRQQQRVEEQEEVFYHVGPYYTRMTRMARYSSQQCGLKRALEEKTEEELANDYLGGF